MGFKCELEKRRRITKFFFSSFVVFKLPLLLFIFFVFKRRRRKCSLDDERGEYGLPHPVMIHNRTIRL